MGDTHTNLWYIKAALTAKKKCSPANKSRGICSFEEFITAAEAGVNLKMKHACAVVFSELAEFRRFIVLTRFLRSEESWIPWNHQLHCLFHIKGTERFLEVLSRLRSWVTPAETRQAYRRHCVRSKTMISASIFIASVSAVRFPVWYKLN